MEEDYDEPWYRNETIARRVASYAAGDARDILRLMEVCRTWYFVVLDSGSILWQRAVQATWGVAVDEAERTEEEAGWEEGKTLWLLYENFTKGRYNTMTRRGVFEPCGRVLTSTTDDILWIATEAMTVAVDVYSCRLVARTAELSQPTAITSAGWEAWVGLSNGSVAHLSLPSRDGESSPSNAQLTVSEMRCGTAAVAALQHRDGLLRVVFSNCSMSVLHDHGADPVWEGPLGTQGGALSRAAFHSTGIATAETRGTAEASSSLVQFYLWSEGAESCTTAWPAPLAVDGAVSSLSTSLENLVVGRCISHDVAVVSIKTGAVLRVLRPFDAENLPLPSIPTSPDWGPETSVVLDSFLLSCSPRGPNELLVWSLATGDLMSVMLAETPSPGEARLASSLVTTPSSTVFSVYGGSISKWVVARKLWYDSSPQWSLVEWQKAVPFVCAGCGSSQVHSKVWMCAKGCDEAYCSMRCRALHGLVHAATCTGKELPPLTLEMAGYKTDLKRARDEGEDREDSPSPSAPHPSSKLTISYTPPPICFVCGKGVGAKAKEVVPCPGCGVAKVCASHEEDHVLESLSNAANIVHPYETCTSWNIHQKAQEVLASLQPEGVHFNAASPYNPTQIVAGGWQTLFAVLRPTLAVRDGGEPGDSPRAQFIQQVVLSYLLSPALLLCQGLRTLKSSSVPLEECVVLLRQGGSIPLPGAAVLAHSLNELWGLSGVACSKVRVVGHSESAVSGKVTVEAGTLEDRVPDVVWIMNYNPDASTQELFVKPSCKLGVVTSSTSVENLILAKKHLGVGMLCGPSGFPNGMPWPSWKRTPQGHVSFRPVEYSDAALLATLP